ncbi:SDR family oxidoreductase [Nocardioides hankookensis]|uniref:SDR family NAD(P)-dependent oxidoreductase n=1 Tax=Nocardioides hankookensis TaxID=443157 RepID=A0ABW1LFG4_9ACTN
MAERHVALVTGSTSGIGESIARRLAADGMHVVVHSGRSRSEGERIAAELGGSYLQADLSDAGTAGAAVAELLHGLGRLDVLINNAAIGWPIAHTDLDAATPEVWRRILEVNLISPWSVAAASAPYLARAGGSIVNISSHAGVRPKGSSVPYAASKAALNHITKLLAVALGPDVRVNAVAPGLVETPMTAAWTDVRDLWLARAPMRRPATPADVADLVAALIANPYVTGEVVLLDGGLNLT